MRLNGRAAVISAHVVLVALAATLFTAVPTLDKGTLFCGPTHPIEPGGKDKQAPLPSGDLA